MSINLNKMQMLPVTTVNEPFTFNQVTRLLGSFIGILCQFNSEEEIRDILDTVVANETYWQLMRQVRSGNCLITTPGEANADNM